MDYQLLLQGVMVYIDQLMGEAHGLPSRARAAAPEDIRVSTAPMTSNSSMGFSMLRRWWGRLLLLMEYRGPMLMRASLAAQSKLQAMILLLSQQHFAAYFDRPIEGRRGARPVVPKAWLIVRRVYCKLPADHYMLWGTHSPGGVGCGDGMVP